MKKLILLLVAMTLVLTACGSAKAKLSADEAKQIALDNAGLSNEDVTFIKAEKDRDDGKVVYEVEFYTKDKREFDYEIDGNTGDILSYDTDAENYKPTSAETSQQETAITEEKVKEIALSKVPGATAENIREFKKEFDDGREKYEGKIVYDKTEYEFEIDAKTGEILKWETESVFD
ncbi:MAG: hypothetical protein E7406_04430 [Ruminococcaceae bacterium]|nr:hypothetical protein [Oscillospiraceae bacterium]